MSWGPGGCTNFYCLTVADTAGAVGVRKIMLSGSLLLFGAKDAHRKREWEKNRVRSARMRPERLTDTETDKQADL